MIAPRCLFPMNNERLFELICEVGQEVHGSNGHWCFMVEGRTVFCLTDEAHDRVRLITPVVETDVMTTKDLRVCMEANFDRALDARYCLHQGALWSAFIHPLGSVSEEMFRSALRQVLALARNYGTNYSSSDLIFAHN